MRMPLCLGPIFQNGAMASAAGRKGHVPHIQWGLALTGRRAGLRFGRAHGDWKSNSAITSASSPSTFASSLFAVVR